MVKKPLSVIILIALLLILAACSPQSSGNLPPPNIEIWIRQDIDGIARFSTDIIRAEVLSSKEERVDVILSDTNSLVKRHNVYDLKVIEVFKGDSEAGDIVKAMQDIESVNNQNNVTLNIGSNLVFFLRSFESDGFGHLPMAFEGGLQGVYWVPSKHADLLADGIETAYLADSSVSDIVLTAFDLYSEITLTIRDLMQIAGVDSAGHG